MTVARKVMPGEYLVTNGDENLWIEGDSCMGVAIRSGDLKRGLANVYEGTGITGSSLRRDVENARKTLRSLLEEFGKEDLRAFVVGILYEPSVPRSRNKGVNPTADYIKYYLHRQGVPVEMNLKNRRSGEKEGWDGGPIAFRRIVLKENELVVVDLGPEGTYNQLDIDSFVF
ncbi:MAG: hypothetical protein NUV97_02820 [archaeon]|nr:hypothetical protein [archaeon]MCR4323818.1 hypothetical protein [Nanoarchaeota archaeon]